MVGGYAAGMIFTLLTIGVVTAVGLVALAGWLHLLPRLGPPGRAVSGWCQRAPGLDGVITVFTVLPGIVGACLAGWWGLGAAIVGQVLAMQGWVFLHEWTHPDARRGPRIVKVLNRVIGRTRNHAALWVMTPAVPVFWLIRVAQWTIYPALVALAKLPPYRQGDFVNLSRQKFDGLVGHDLIWCLYCDWMTGLWSLGSEMLRNIESLWCPIRFHSDKKCENCRHDFPDLDHGWVDADAGMTDVAALLEAKYADRDGPNAWFGHPTRLTVEGEPPQSS